MKPSVKAASCRRYRWPLLRMKTSLSTAGWPMAFSALRQISTLRRFLSASDSMSEVERLGQGGPRRLGHGRVVLVVGRLGQLFYLAQSLEPGDVRRAEQGHLVSFGTVCPPSLAAGGGGA